MGVTRRETGFSGVSFVFGAERLARPHPETFSAGASDFFAFRALLALVLDPELPFDLAPFDLDPFEEFLVTGVERAGRLRCFELVAPLVGRRP